MRLGTNSVSSTAEESSVYCNLGGQITGKETAEAEVSCLWADNSNLVGLSTKPGFVTLDPMPFLFGNNGQKCKTKRKL